MTSRPHPGSGRPGPAHMNSVRGALPAPLAGTASPTRGTPHAGAGPGQVQTAELVAQMRAAARQAGIEDDGPLTPLLKAFMRTLENLGELTDRQERTSINLADALKAALLEARHSADAETERFRVGLAAAKLGIIDEISDNIARKADAAFTRRVRVFDRNTALLAAGALVAAVVVAFAGGVWWGNSTAEASIHQTQAGLVAAFNGGPDTARLWLDLMTWNNPIDALAQCTRNFSLTFIQDGRRACQVPLWIGPPAPQPPPPPADVAAALADAARKLELERTRPAPAPADTPRSPQRPGPGVMHFGP